jgi:SAM-dependent methyltransferase
MLARVDEPLIVESRAQGDDALAWAAERIAAHARGLVLDVGCGDGRFLPPHGVGVDLDEASLRIALSRSPRVARAGAHALPFSDSAFDTVMANRMLNHAGRIDDALAEMKRVLRPGGHLVALTLASPPRSPLERLHEEARAALGRGRPPFQDRLDEDNGEARLSRHFARVRVERFSRTHRFEDAAAALDHYARRRLFRGNRSTEETSRLFEHVRRGIRELSASQLVDEEHAALFVAENV